MKKILPIMLICLLLLAGCGQQKEEGKTLPAVTTAVQSATLVENPTAAEIATQPVEPEGRIVTDMKGNQITVPKEVKKIMTCVTVGTQMILMLGDVDNVATLGQGFVYTEGSFLRKMYPGLDDVPAVTRNDAANMEAVAKIAPDVVLIDVPDTAAALNNVGVPALFQGINNTDELKTSVRLVGELLGGDAVAKGEAWCNYYDSIIASVSEKTAQLKAEDKPLVWFARGAVNSSGLKSIPHDWVTAAGGRNMASELGLEGSRVEMNAEEIMKANPDIIICADARVYDAIKAEAKYADLKAVKDGKVFVNPAGAGTWDMAAPENALQWYWAPTVIQPELFADIDMEQVVKDYYKQFYGYELSDEEVKTILKK